MKKTDAAPSQTKSAIAPAVNNAVKNLPVKELRTLEGHTASVVAVKFSSKDSNSKLETLKYSFKF
jgi:hypothetical protein